MRQLKRMLPLAIAFSLGSLTVYFLSRTGGEIQAAAGLKPEIILYSEPNFQGREIHLFEDAIDLPYEDLSDGTKMFWNDNVGSIVVVSGTWRLYQHGRMNTAIDDTPKELVDLRTKALVEGWSTLVSGVSGGSLRIASPEHLGMGFDISSIQLVSSLNLPDWVYGRN